MDTVSVLIDLLSHGKNEHNRYVLWREDKRVRPCTEGTSEAKEGEMDHNESDCTDNVSDDEKKRTKQ